MQIMKQQSNHRPAICKPGLHLLLLLFLSFGCLAVATGTTYARYRAEKSEELLFEVRKPDQLVLGTIREEKFVPFSPTDQLTWEIDGETGTASLTFSVANGTDLKNYSDKDQTVKLRVLGSLNLALPETLPETETPPETETQPVDEIPSVVGIPPELVVTYASKKLNGDAVEREGLGEASYLTAGTELHYSYGPSLLYSFYETTAEGKYESTWELPGGQLSYITLTIKTVGDAFGMVGQLQPLIIAEPKEN